MSAKQSFFKITQVKATTYLTKYCLAAVMLAASTSNAAAEATIQEKLAELEAEIQQLKQQSKQQPKPENKSATAIKIGGFIKADFIFSDYSDGRRATSSIGDDFLVPSTIPVGGENSDNVFDANAKFSRLWLKTTTSWGDAEVSTYLETDFNAANDERLVNQASYGLRHAFLQYDYNNQYSLLAGQTWSTFFNVAALPEAADFIGPTSGTVFVRQTQLRWSNQLDAERSLMVAIENPSTGLLDGGAGVSNNQYDNNRVPDLIVRFNAAMGNLRYTIAGLVREISYQDTLAIDEETGINYDGSKSAAALSVSGVYPLAGSNKIKFMWSYGVLGRYIALAAFRDGAIEASGDIDLINTMGGFIAYEHHWSDRWRSTFTYAQANTDNPASVAGSAAKAVSNSYVNLMYSPVPKLTFGGELMAASRELENGEKGDLARVQFMAKLVF